MITILISNWEPNYVSASLLMAAMENFTKALQGDTAAMARVDDMNRAAASFSSFLEKSNG